MESVQSAVGPWRARFDPMAGFGVPAHVTVLFPFLPAERIDTGVLTELAAAVAQTAAFEATFTGTAWFGDDVLWLAPEPAAAFRELTLAVWQRFPECPPYGGEHPEITPHLTVGHRAARPEMEEAERDLGSRLPLTAPVTQVSLLVGPPSPTGKWSTAQRFPLSPVG
jgi:2'-5' RNA ligase